MMGVQDLCTHFGLSDKAVRRRLDALAPVISPHMTRGENNAILLTDAAWSIFDRLIQVERETKRGVNAAVDLVIDELRNGGKPEGEPHPNGGNRSEVISLLQVQVEDLRRREKDLMAERDRLLSMLEARDDQMKALMPGPRPYRPDSPNGEQKPSRWQALRYVLLGR